ncbi:MAG: diaminopimelate decarboxylase [Gaiellaceae bacterium]|nr:diaminopimelate decarboxylase [Gaiellaceae bacterium]
MALLDLFPDSAALDAGELSLGGVRASALAEQFGTPLVVYCEETLRARARAYREAAPTALVAYGSKAFPNLAILRLLAGEGLGADVSTLGELELAVQAGVPAERLVVHGNNKSDAFLARVAQVGCAYVVLDAPDEPERAAAAGVQRVLVRVTPGIDVDTHEAISTGHHGSKFGLTPEQTIEVVGRARGLGLDVAGLHIHLGSQLLDTVAPKMLLDWLAGFVAVCRTELGWAPEVVDFGGGLGVRHTEDETAPSIADWVGDLEERLRRDFSVHGLPQPGLILEPGRSLVGEAGVTLYTVGVVKEAAEGPPWVAVDGGLSDNPRPLQYGARYEALIANRAGDPTDRSYAVCGHHCESGDVLIRRVALPAPRRGDLLAIPATGAYTLAMGSNYNATPRPAALLVAGGEAKLIRRRETLEDLLALEV